MAQTRIIRKEARNRALAKRKKQKITKLTHQPKIKNIDKEAIKKEFEEKKKGKAQSTSKSESAASGNNAQSEQEDVKTNTEENNQ